MELPVQITFKGLPSSPTLETRIRAKAEKLERFHSRIIGCRVLVEAANRQAQQGRYYVVRVDVTVPGTELFASRETGSEHDADGLFIALRDAFAAVTRQLEDHVQKRRGDVKHHEAS